jgi:hypothetical protein
MSTDQKANIVHREAPQAIRPAKEFGRPPESVAKSCRAKSRLIANGSEASR